MSQAEDWENKIYLDFSGKLNRFKFARENYFNYYRKDPLASLFIHFFGLSPLKSALLGLALVLFTYMSGFTLFLILKTQIAGITVTGIDIVFDFCLVPVVYGFYLWISSRPQYVFLKLLENRIFLNNEKKYNEFVIHFTKNIINNRFVYLFSFMAALGVGFYHICGAASGSEIWGSKDAVYFVFYYIKVPITWMPAWYMTCVIFLKSILTIWGFRVMLRQKYLKINISHKDYYGGLKPLIDFSITVSYFIMACGFGLTLLITRGIKLNYFRRDILVHLSLLCYLLISFSFLYLSLHPVQKIIIKSKQKIGNKLKCYNHLILSVFTPSTVCRFVMVLLAPILVYILLL